MTFIAKTANELAESGIIPDSFIRTGIRRLVQQRKMQVSGPTRFRLPFSRKCSGLTGNTAAVIGVLASETWMKRRNGRYG
jgi:hypothetical protein